MIGGGGLAYFFVVKTDGTTGALSLANADGATAATVLADAILKVGGDYDKGNILIQTDLSTTDDGKLTAKFTQNKNYKVFDTFMKTVNPRTAGATTASTEELSDETGQKVGGAAAASSVNVLMMSYSAPDTDGTVHIYSAIGTVSKTMSISYQANTYVKPSLEFTSKAVSHSAGLLIPKVMFDPAKIDATDTTIALGLTLGQNMLYDNFIVKKKP